MAVSIGTKGAGVRKAMPAAEIGDQMTQNEYVLDSVLERCSQAAQKGYDEAAKHTKYLKDTLERARNEVKSALKDFEKSSIYDSGVTEVLGGQLKDIQSRFSRLSDSFDSGLRKLRENLSKFSITLFGRTMAGKSTLMEILKQGDGSSIGKGAQRTTRDVRKYQWNGLEITDVPGIGAFKGQEDEAIAFEAARKADLILFLLTDDAPQAAEAECFARIIKLGKPVICIMNVRRQSASTMIRNWLCGTYGIVLTKSGLIPLKGSSCHMQGKSVRIGQEFRLCMHTSSQLSLPSGSH